MAQPSPSSDLFFNVRRQKPELISPAKPTPHELKPLSAIDSQYFLRFQLRYFWLYGSESSMVGKDPVKVIRDALAKALVFYYPLAGRLGEGEGRKLMVECNEEGAMFIEADADVTLEQFDDHLQPPFPCFEELLYSPPGSAEILHSPILLIQVTRLKCGGFIVALRMNHTIADVFGIIQFMRAMADIAKGATKPSILPVWQRELLNARDPPHVAFTHREYDEEAIDSAAVDIATTNTVHRSFFFGPNEVSSLRRLLPDHLRQSASSSELVMACLWRCRTNALHLDEPQKDVRMSVVVNVRFGDRQLNPPLPEGYYGNTVVFPVAVSSAGELYQSPLGYGLELIKKAKAQVNDEYVHSVADLIATKGPTFYETLRSCVVSDLTRLGLKDVDFGWGKAVFASLALTGVEMFGGRNYVIEHRNSKGEKGRVVPICLPPECMERFAKEMDRLLSGRITWQIQESTSDVKANV